MPPKNGPRTRILDGIAVTVTVVWAIAVLAQVFDPSRQVSLNTHLIMGAVVSGLFGFSVYQKTKNGNGNGGPPSA